MRNGIPNFRAVALHGAHFPPMQYEASDFRDGQHLDVKQDAPATKMSLADRFKRFYNFSTRTSGITHLRKYCHTTWHEAQHLSLTPTHVKESFPPSSTFRGPASSTFARPPTHVSTMLHNAALLRRKQTAAGLRIPIATHATTDNSISAAYIRQLSTNMREDTVPLASMKAHLTTHRKDIFAVKQLPPGVRPEDTYPSRSKLIAKRAFGKHNLARSYTVPTSLSHITILLWKYNYFPTITAALRDAHGPIGQLAFNNFQRSRNIDFSALQILPLDWDITEATEQDEQAVLANKTILQDACLIHYNLDLECLQRFCGGRWMGEHRRTVQALRILSHILPDKLFLPYAATLIEGVPNCLHGHVPSDELYTNLATDNLQSVKHKPELVTKAIKKEKVNHLSFTCSRELARFTPNLGVIKIGILSKEGKKSRVFRHGSLTTHNVRHPINKLCDVKATEPEIKYGTVLADHCQYAWSIAKAFPNTPIDLYDDDISGAFPQHVLHPSIVSANASFFKKQMIVSIGLHFGGNFGPSSWEPTSDVRSFLVPWLYKYCNHMQDINEEALSLMDWPKQSAKAWKRDSCRIRPPTDNGTMKVKSFDGTFVPHYRMFVDDGLTAAPRNKDLQHIKQTVAASCEAAYLCLGYPGPIKQPILPAVMAWDKIYERLIGIIRLALGIVFESKWLEITIEDYKVERLVHLLSQHWNISRKQFTCLDAARLIGNVLYCAQVAQHLRWSMHHLCEEMKRLLRRNTARLAKTRHFQQLLAECDESWLDSAGKNFARFTMFNRSFLSRVWHCQSTAFISTAIRQEIAYILAQCKEHLSGQHLWKRPISHIVDRTPDAHGRQDASTKWGMGGYCASLRCWWQIKWTDLDPRVHQQIQQKRISINVLELTAIIVNYVAIAYGYTFVTTQYQPRALFGGDNTTADAWYYKFANPNVSARTLTKLLAFFMKYSRVGLDVEHLAGILNFFADAISRGTPIETLHSHFKSKCPTNTLAKQCLQVPSHTCRISFKRFRPAEEILQLISSALLVENTAVTLLPKPKTWGHFAPEQNISFDFSKDWVWTLH